MSTEAEAREDLFSVAWNGQGSQDLIEPLLDRYRDVVLANQPCYWAWSDSRREDLEGFGPFTDDCFTMCVPQDPPCPTCEARRRLEGG